MDTTQLPRQCGYWLISLLFLMTTTSCFRNLVTEARRSIELEGYFPAIEADSSAKEFTSLSDLSNSLGINDTLKILMVHGMRNKSGNHFEGMSVNMAHLLEYQDKHPVLEDRIASDPKRYDDKNKRLIDKLQISSPSNQPWIATTFLHTDLYYNKQKQTWLKVYRLEWSPITRTAKNLLTKQLDKDDFRTHLSSFVKERYLIDVFGDLALYLNEDYKNALLGAVGSTVRNMAIEDSEDKSRLAIVTGSFGSFMVTDFIKANRQSKEAEECIENFIDKLGGIYMISNQLPWSSLTHLPFDTTGQEQINAALNKNTYANFQVFCDAINIRERNPLNIVAFYDPNDVFGFPLPPTQEPALFVTNISVNNTLVWEFSPKKVQQLALNIKDKKIRDGITAILDLDSDRQRFIFELDKANEESKNNPAILAYMVFGKKEGFEKLKNLALKAGKATNYREDRIISKRKKLKEKTVSAGKIKQFKLNKKNQLFETTATNTTRSSNMTIYKENFNLKRAITPFVVKRASKKINKIAIQPAILPYQKLEEGIDFEGLAESVKSNKVTNVVTLHGMRTKPSTHFDEMADQLALKLGFDPDSKKVFLHRDTLSEGAENRIYQDGLVKEIVFTKHHACLELRRVLRFYIIHWSDVTKKTKQWLNNPTFHKNNAKPGGLLRESIIIDGFADVSLAFGKSNTDTLKDFKYILHHLIDKALKMTTKRPDTRHLPLGKLCGDPISHLRANQIPSNFIISGSLGSKIIFDHLFLEEIGKMEEGWKSTKDGFVKNLHSVFMLTNQLPFIGLKQLNPQADLAAWQDSIYNYGEADSIRLTLLRGNHKINIINFYDPNDVLNFKLPENAPPHFNMKTVNVNIAQGYTLNNWKLYKLLKQIDRLLIDGKYLRKNGNKRGFILPHAVPLMNTPKCKTARPTYVLRLDVAHSAAPEHPLILELMANGTTKAKRQPEPDLTEICPD